MSTDLSAGRRLFAANIKRREDRIDLALAALLIAIEEYPHLVVEDYLERLDQLAAGLAVEIDLEADLRTLARTIGAFMAHEQGFEGDADDYYNPRNSYLNEVMDRRRGIPISLGLLYMEVARRVNVALLPVGMPSHFLLKLQRDGEEVFLDPFHRGQVLDHYGARDLFASFHHGRIPFSDSMLAAITKRQVLTRMLNNLKAIYIQADDYERALRIVELLTLIAPWDLDEVRDRGLLRFRLNRFEDAIPDLEAYCRYGPPGPEIETVRDALRRITPP
ncbi:MAG TPA: transglutaminase-like domain-containing protein [Dehalococcoidia bacterium]|nr:transglutaminase-like domain-containing protein [Dehalococcoidia bacterium]